jgi:hypothetical protein
MERALRMIASSLVLLCGAAQATTPEQAPPARHLPAGDAICDAEADQTLVLDEGQRRHCHDLRQFRIDETRRRHREHVRQVIEQNRQRRELEASLPPPPPPPVTIETFMNAGSLSYGDVVVTDRGPRVFIGKPGEAATPEDFVAVDSSRSPHRARAMQFDGAFPERRAPRPTPPHRERQP